MQNTFNKECMVVGAGCIFRSHRIIQEEARSSYINQTIGWQLEEEEEEGGGEKMKQEMDVEQKRVMGPQTLGLVEALA